MKIIGLDPGNAESAWVLLVDGKPREHAKENNAAVLEFLRSTRLKREEYLLAVEMIASFGMPVGREVFDTCLWIGRFVEAWDRLGGQYKLVYRQDVKRFHCNSMRANDASIRQALIDRYGPGRDKAIGTMRARGPLHGIRGDEWSALAVALVADGVPSTPPLFRELQPQAGPELEPEKEPF